MRRRSRPSTLAEIGRATTNRAVFLAIPDYHDALARTVILAHQDAFGRNGNLFRGHRVPRIRLLDPHEHWRFETGSVTP
jgi:hypothetical protein